VRLWLVHPKYLDAVELIHSWRLGLLAQKHFRESEVLDLSIKENKQFDYFYGIDLDKRLRAIGYYLLELWNEAERREYTYNKELIDAYSFEQKITVSQSDVRDDFLDLLEKYVLRAKNFHEFIRSEEQLELHPIFVFKKGGKLFNSITLTKATHIL
jgi:hypothetical protein